MNWKRFVTALVALVILGGGIATATLLTSSEIEQLEKSGPQWADATTYGGYGVADRLQYMNTDGSYSGPSSYRITVVGGVGNIAEDDLVYVSGHSGGYPVVLPADADAIATMRNLYFCPDAIAAGAEGYAYKRKVMDVQNTNSGEVGDPVYVDTVTPGGWTLTKPSGAADIVQEIGVVIVKSATVGKIDVDIGGGPEQFDIKTLVALAAAPAIDDLFTLADESVAGDPTKSITLQYMFNGVNTLAAIGAAPAITDSLFLNDGGVAKKVTMQNLFNGIAGFTAFSGPVVEGTDQVFLDDGGVVKRCTLSEFFASIDDVAALAAGPALTDKVLLGDAGVAKSLTIQYLFDGANGLAAEAVVNGDSFMLIDSTGVAKKEAIADLATLLAGTGLAANSSVLSVTLSTCAAGTVDVTADSVVFLDADAASASKITSIQAMLNDIADLADFTGVVVPATDEILYLDAGVAKASTVQVLFDGVQDLTALTPPVVPGTDVVLMMEAGVATKATYQVFMDGIEDLVATDVTFVTGTDKLLVSDGGVAVNVTYQVLMNGVNDLGAGAVATTDKLLMIDAGDGVAKAETIDDIATLFAGTGLTAAAGVIGVDTTQALESISGTTLIINSTNAMTLQIGTVDILQVDDAAITFAGAADTAGQDCYVGTEAGGAATTGTAGDVGGLLTIKSGDGSAGATGENQDGAVGGALTLQSGAGGAAGLSVAGTADGKNAGAISVTGGVGGAGGLGAGGEGGVGASITLTGGTGGAGTTKGAGGAIAINAGTAGGAGATGGALSLTGGAANGGTAGAITIGATNTASIGIGAADITTTITGIAVVGQDDAGAGINDALALLHSASDAAGAAIGDGIGITFDQDNSANTVEEWGSIDHVATNITNGTEEGDFVLSQMTAGAVTETLRLVANSTTTTADYLQFTANTTETDGVIEMMRLITEVAGAAGTTGLGSSINIYLDDATAAAASEAASIDFVLTDGVDSQEDADIIFSTLLNTAVQPALTIDASDQSVTLGQNVTDTDGVDKLRIFPLTTARGSLVLQAALSAGDTVTTITNASQAAERAYTIPDSGASASEFLLTDRTKTKWTFMIAGANGEDTDGVLTNTGGIAGGSKPTGVTSTEAAAAYCKVYDAGTTSYQNLATSQTGTDVTSNYQIFSDTKGDGDAIYFGAAVPFCEIGIDMGGTVQDYTGDAITWYYYNGTNWTTALTVFDNTDATAQDGKRSFGRDGVVNFVPPANWAAVAVDSQSAYWIKAEITTVANVGANKAVTNSVEHYVISPDGDAVQIPYKCNISEVRVSNLGATVHDQIVKFVLFNFTKGTYSLELSWAASQPTDTFTTTVLKAASAGVDCDASDVIGILITEDNGATNNPTNIMVELDVTLTD